MKQSLQADLSPRGQHSPFIWKQVHRGNGRVVASQRRNRCTCVNILCRSDTHKEERTARYKPRASRCHRARHSHRVIDATWVLEHRSDERHEYSEPLDLKSKMGER